jgi:hypothetical protein
MNVNGLKFPFVAALAGLLFAATGYQKESRSSSCHLCRNTQSRQVVRFFGLPLHSATKASAKYPISPGHTHNWFQFLRFQSLGYNGWMQIRVACKPDMYRDGKMPDIDLRPRSQDTK